MASQKFQEATGLLTNILTPYITSIKGTVSQSNYPNGFSLVESMMEQNKLFKHQQSFIETEMTKLKKISQNLLEQNVQLRSLYKQRTHDISKLVNTFAINTEEVINDYQHQQFLITELNFNILKQIKEVVKEKEQIQGKSLYLRQECDLLHKSNIEIEQEVINKLKIKFKNSLNHKAISRHQEQQEAYSDKINDLENEVASILIKNKELLNFINHFNSGDSICEKSLKKKKEEILRNNQKVKGENNRYKAQILNDKGILQITSKKCIKMQERYNRSCKGLNEQLNKKLSIKYLEQDLIKQKENIRARTNQLIRQKQVHGEDLDKLHNQKTELADRIKNIKYKIKKFKGNQYLNNQENLNTNKQNIKNFNNVIIKNKKSGEQEIVKLVQQKTKVVKLIADYQIDCKSLQDQIQQYSHVVKGLTNPIIEIQKMQMRRKIYKNQ